MRANPSQVVKPRWADTLAAILLLAALAIAAARLMATDWTTDLNIMPLVTLLGCSAGLALGYSRFSGLTSIFFALSYGIFTVFWRLGSTMERVIPWNERIFSILGRLDTTITQLMGNEDIYDSLLFITAMGFLFWMLSVHAGYSIFRHGDPWSAILPMGAALFIIHINDKFWPFRAWYLGVYLVLSLLLVARFYYLKLRHEWLQNRTRTPTYVGLDMTRAALIAAVPLILIAWTAPALAQGLPIAQEGWQQISQPMRDRFDNLFASLKATVGVVSDYYSDTLSLGQGNELSNMVVMEVEAPLIRPVGVRYYWKARTYDFYTSNGWLSTLTDFNEPISPDIFDQQIAASAYHWKADITVNARIPLRTIHTAPGTYSVSRPGTASAFENLDGSVDVHTLEADPYLRSGEQYELKAALVSASQKELREAGTDYPDWILERYLQLPDTITPRTRELAQRIIAGIENPYDQVEAVTYFLRENITYSERIDAPPEDQERVDWLLFDYRQGFCNYYATAEVVLLRSLGIPARIAVGYAEGEREMEDILVPQSGMPDEILETLPTDTGNFIVRQSDLHAWPEVYFPGIGWVEFEPTQNQLAIFRASGADLAGENPAAPEEQQSEESPANRDDPDSGSSDLLPELPVVTPQQQLLQLITRSLLLVGSIGLLFLALWGIRRRLPPEPIMVQLETRMQKWGMKPPKFITRLAIRAGLPPLTKAYMEINFALRRLGKSPAQADTPAERVHQLTNLIPESAYPANYLLNEYQAQMYSPHPASGEEAYQAGKQIRNISLWAWFNRLIARWQTPPEKRRRYEKP
jgi:transglutaminase-like putative cysteine protease